MNPIQADPAFSTYAFRFQNEWEDQPAQLRAVGLQYKTADYQWDGKNRRMTGFIVFQYTISGYGLLEIDGEHHRLTPGHGFFLQIPGPHVYWRPKESDHWEFIFIELVGYETIKTHEWVMNKAGPVCRLHSDSKPIACLHKILENTKQDLITDEYQASAMAYEFLMELRRELSTKETQHDMLPKSIAAAIDYMHRHFNKPLFIEDVAKRVGLSPFHFTRTFLKHMNVSPISYLTKLRIEEAVKLLRQPDLKVETIAVMAGFTNSNYFIQVFRQVVGVSPGKFRKQSHDYLLLK